MHSVRSCQQESRADSRVTRHWGPGGASQLLAHARWAVLPAGAAAPGGGQLPCCCLSPLFAGLVAEIVVPAQEHVVASVPYWPGYFLSQLFCKDFFLPEISVTPVFN